jgi:hypothetical protein
MKKLTMPSGIVASFLFLVGVLLKTQHYPGSGFALVLGILLFAIVYAPMLFIDRNKLTQDKTQKLVNIMSLLSIIVIPIAFLFKAMHWPGAAIGIYIGSLILLVMIPVLFIHGSKETDATKKLNFFNEAVILVLLFAFSLFIWLVTHHPVVNP